MKNYNIELGNGWVVYNPKEKPVLELPTITVSSLDENIGTIGTLFVSLAEDGACLGSHFCSNSGYAFGDLGVIAGRREDRHEIYRKHYPDGYRMRFVHPKEVRNDAIFTKALELNKTYNYEESNDQRN